ncbi:hypothetical protein ACX80H_12130 [Arthrobacter sp. MDT2-2]
MAGRRDKASAFLKNGAGKAKAAGAKAYSIANDPEAQAKAKKVIEGGRKAYQVATSPEAKRAYRQVANAVKKMRKK